MHLLQDSLGLQACAAVEFNSKNCANVGMQQASWRYA